MDRTVPLNLPHTTSAPVFSLRRLTRPLDHAAKRVLDFVAALLGLLLLYPFFLVIANLIRKDSPGPIFYRGRRVGLHGHEFQILKFRTMREEAQSYAGPKVTSESDTRITPLGRWLRKTKINELPQLWNVLVGEMSLIGPRPEDPDIVATWPESVRVEVLSLRPGITSPASVLYRNEESLLAKGDVMETYLQSVLPSKLRLDQLYVRHRNFWLDLDILFQTILAVVPLLKWFVPGEDSLFLGPLSRLSRRYLNWFMIDTAITFGAIGIAGLVWRLSAPLDIGVGPALGIALGFSFLFSIIGWLLGMNRISWSHAWASDSFGLFISAGLAYLCAMVVNEAWPGPTLLPYAMVTTASGLALLGFVVFRYRSRLISGLAYRWLARTGAAIAARERVLIVGSGETGQFVAWLLSNGSIASAFQVVGFVDDDLYKQSMRYHGVSVVGRRADIPRLVQKHDVGILIFAIHNIKSDERRAVLEICGRTPAHTIMVPDIAGSLKAAIALKTRSNRNGHGKGNGSGIEHLFEDPVERAQPSGKPGIPPAEAQLWLADLEKLAQSGDLAALGDRIRSIREGIEYLSTSQ